FQASRRRPAARIPGVSSDESPALQTSRISARSRTLQPGELVVLSIALPAPAGHVRVRAFGRDVAAYAEGDREWRALVGIDLDVKPGTYSVTADADGGADSGPDRRRARPVFFREHRGDRPRTGIVLDARASVGDRRARGGPRAGGPDHRPRRRDGTRHRSASALGRARQRRASGPALAARVAGNVIFARLKPWRFVFDRREPSRSVFALFYTRTNMPTAG